MNIKSIKDVTNVGLYLTAYLSNIKVDADNEEENVVKTNENSRIKKIIKGRRLYLYPKGFRIYRLSKGIKRPIVYKTTEEEAMKKLKDAELTYEKTLCIDREYPTQYRTSYINYRTFNLNKKGKKDDKGGKYYEKEQ